MNTNTVVVDEEEEVGLKLETHLAIVFGKPGFQGSKRLVKTHDGRMVMIEASQKADEKFTETGKSWRQALIQEMLNDRPDEPINDAVCIKLLVYVPRPQSHLRSNGSLKSSAPRFPGGKPDLDKVMRAVGDAATIAKWVKDDSRIAEWRGNPGHGPQRLYLDEPSDIQRCVVAMWSLEQEWLLDHPESKQKNLLDFSDLIGYTNREDQEREHDHE